MFDSRVVLLGEITSQSLLGVKGLKALIHLHIEDSKELEVEQSQLKDALLQKHCQNINWKKKQTALQANLVFLGWHQIQITDVNVGLKKKKKKDKWKEIFANEFNF